MICPFFLSLIPLRPTFPKGNTRATNDMPFNCHLEMTFLHHITDEYRHLVASYLTLSIMDRIIPSLINDLSVPYTQEAASRRFKDLCLTLIV